MGGQAGRDARLVSVQVGRIAPLGPDAVPSAFVKQPIGGPVAVGPLGLQGDEQADLSVHGGADKAVYGYGLANYDIWRDTFPEHRALLQAGAFGENLTIAGLDETAVCLGDVVKIGSAVLQVSQPRQPCFKFALRFNDARMPRAMAKNGCCGWYYSVVRTGFLSAGDTVELERRPNGAWTIDRISRLMLTRTASVAELKEMVALEGLAEAWRMEILESMG